MYMRHHQASFLPLQEGLAKHLLSCHPQEGCLAAEKGRERGERRERRKAKPKIKDFIYKNRKLTKLFSQRLMLRVTKQEGLI